MIPVTLAVEDLICEALIEQVIAQNGIRIQIEQSLQRKGKSHVRSKVDSLNRAAFGGVRSLVVVDADFENQGCAAEIARSWFPSGRSANLAFRVAMRESESWVLADSEGVASFLGISPGRVPQNPEGLIDPKRALVDLARRSPRAEIRSSLVPSQRAVVGVGVNYNGALSGFIRSGWSYERAATRSETLVSLRNRIERLATI